MRKKRTTGSSLARRAWLQAALFLPLAVVGITSASAKDKPKKQLAPYAVIAGTVFREEGFSLPGAEVIVTSSSPQAGKKQRTVSDARGEFAVRVPAVPAEYTVSVQRAGFAGQEKTVKVEGEGSFEVTFRLSSAGKEGIK